MPVPYDLNRARWGDDYGTPGFMDYLEAVARATRESNAAFERMAAHMRLMGEIISEQFAEFLPAGSRVVFDSTPVS